MDKNNILVVSSSGSSAAASQIKDWIIGRGRGRTHSHQSLTFDEYLAANEDLYASLVSNH